MKKIILLITAVLVFGFESMPATVANIKKLKAEHIPIVDIRTPDEWMQTGVIPGAIKDTFFDRYGRVNSNFLRKLHGIKKFAVICRTGHRSKLVAEILEKNGMQVIDLEGGMFYLMRDMLHKEFKRK